MKFVPRRNEVIGRIVVKRVLHTIVRPDETKNTTKFLLVDGVGSDAAAAGIKVGDIVLAQKFGNILLDGGVSFRPLVDEKDVRAWVTGVSLDELVVQTDNGSEFVPFQDMSAAKSLCESDESEWVASRKVSASEARA